MRPVLSALAESLTAIVQRTSREVAVTPESTEASGLERIQLEREESEVATQIMSLRTRLDQMNRLRSSLQDYSEALEKQRERLGLSRWLREMSNNDVRCPVCSSALGDAHKALDSLCDALAETENNARQVSPAPAAFDRETLQVREQIRVGTDRLEGLRIRKRAHEEANAKSRESKNREMAADRFLGRAEQALKVYVGADDNNETREEIERMRRELNALRDALSEGKIRERIRAALQRVSIFMGRVLPVLDVEGANANNPVELSIDDLTLRVTNKSGRTDFLWEIGSGANWLAYHVAAILSLQLLFLEQQQSPVPNLVVLDQPSQVYFPRAAARSTASSDPNWTDEDVSAVRKVFLALVDTVNAAKGKLQCIVLDHADEDVWGVVSGVKLVEEWRGEHALVPENWISR